MKYEVAYITQTCYACPSQWEGKTIRNEYVYIRYRWGWLECEIDGDSIFQKRIGDDEYDGLMDFDEMKANLSVVLDFENFQFVPDN